MHDSGGYIAMFSGSRNAIRAVQSTLDNVGVAAILNFKMPAYICVN